MSGKRKSKRAAAQQAELNLATAQLSTAKQLTIVKAKSKIAFTKAVHGMLKALEQLDVELAKTLQHKLTLAFDSVNTDILALLEQTDNTSKLMNELDEVERSYSNANARYQEFMDEQKCVMTTSSRSHRSNNTRRSQQSRRSSIDVRDAMVNAGNVDARSNADHGGARSNAGNGDLLTDVQIIGQQKDAIQHQNHDEINQLYRQRWCKSGGLDKAK